MSRTLHILVSLAIAAAAASHDDIAAQTTPGTQRAVLVTGASSGIGRRIAEKLATSGYFVYGGARKPEDIAALSAIPNIRGIRLDVTIPAEIAAAADTIRRAGRGLYAVVNNAGVAIIAPLIEVDERELQYLLDVNTLGPYRVTKAFSSLLIESQGRVVNISSISGILSGAMLGPYSMSKHAIEAYGDALAAEMGRFGVRVSLIEPGNYRSDIGTNVLARIPDVDAAVRGSRFEQQMRGTLDAMRRYETYPEPDSVAAAALHAISSPSPRMRYMVVPAQNQALATIRKAMDELVQLNDGHQFSYDREALIRMLDEAIARERQGR
jgi:NAD(P)-dependent dehydrogenase (short-subunit alcohol dehydrogenase family)